MKFIYIISKPNNSKIVLKFICPYVLEEAAKRLLKTYISENKKVLSLPTGNYMVTLVRNDEDCKVLSTHKYTLSKNGIKWQELLDSPNT